MEFLAWLLVGLTLIPVVVFAVECLLGVGSLGAEAATEPPPFAVLIPAHDEALGIAATIDAVRAQLRPCDRLLVVADNCSDGTAEIARGAGGEVLERHDAARRGKGFALAAGRDLLQATPPAVVIILDADCLPGRNCLPRLAAQAACRGAAIQAHNMLCAGREATPLIELSGFAFLVKNFVRQRGLQRLGGSAHLQGTGMAVPWAMFSDAPLASASLAEDMALGLDLHLAGHRVEFAPHLTVRSAASSQSSTLPQRTRWEHGHLAIAHAYVPRLLAAAARGRVALAVLALDLIVPPLALLVLALLATVAAALVLLLLTGEAGPLMGAMASISLLIAMILLAWHAVGREHLRLATLLRVPAYLGWKIPIYQRLLGNRQREWVRTSRET